MPATHAGGARRSPRKLDKPTRERIVKAAQLLSNNPHSPAAKQLVGTTGAAATFRIRTGDWWLHYAVRDHELTVLIVKVGHRREVYRGL